MPKKNVGRMIKCIDNLIMRNAHQITGQEEEKISPLQGWIMGYLYFNRDKVLYQKDLEQAFNLPKSTLATILKQLDEKGLVIRENAEHDTRLKKISLSDLGCTLQHNFLSRLQEIEYYICEDIPEEELDSFYATAEKMQRNLERHLNNRKESNPC